MGKTTDAATRTIHLQGVGRVPAVEAQDLSVGDQLMYNSGSVYQITKIEDASPKFFRIFQVSTETGEEYSRRVKKDRLAARVPEGKRRRLGHDAPATNYRAQVCAPQGGIWVTVSHGDTAKAAACGRTPLNQFSYFGSVMLGRHGLGDTYDARVDNMAAMAAGATLTAENGHRFRILPPEQPSVSVEAAALAQKYPLGAAAVFTPEGATERDVVVVNSAPDADGTVEVLSARQNGKALRVPLAALEELPALPPAPEGDPTDYWTVTDDKGQEVTRVRAETRVGARTEVERNPQAAAVAKRLGGLFYRRLSTSELPPELRAALEADTARQAAPRALGCLPGSVDVPQVKAAIRLLTHDGQPLAAFDERDRCLSAGAYLDPRRETGEVVLEFLAEHRPAAGRKELADEQERVTLEYAALFRMAGWTVQEFQERDHTGQERLARLILTPPTPHSV
ncbi:hypothetical protein SAMN05216483_6696 [Streptomyces sp. 2131.1]|uniref:hypothetical protein n=1 Tax=Streptomyces sp. 2131.1 TaxID=1855346 RepID=UPI00089900B5|nr:hypothetical protein [Streptomyces sp. 2131.1]SEE83142.1 hypothetical protein SAMN05216483_6696 [Streptomyces sp. 2131.1]